MIEVVKSGTGTAGAIPQAQVAGKTGTAELASLKDTGGDTPTATTDPDAEPEHDVDAWFSAFAPADKPKLAVAVMIVNADGDGGVVAAPIASQIFSGTSSGRTATTATLGRPLRGRLRTRVCPGAFRAERGVGGRGPAWQRHVGLRTVAIPRRALGVIRARGGFETAS